MSNRTQYDEEPVMYCKECLSLKVMDMGGVADYCEDCGSLDIGEASIEEWQIMYKERYGHEYI